MASSYVPFYPTNRRRPANCGQESPSVVVASHGFGLFRAIAKAKKSPKVEVAICPPFIYLEGLSRAYKKMSTTSRPALGAQDVFWEEQGAFTSEDGPKMLRGIGIKYAIIGD